MNNQLTLPPDLRGYFTLKSLLHSGLGNKWCPLMRVTLHFFRMSLMWSWHWSPLAQTSLLLSPSDGLASFLETTLANGVEKVITSKFRFHLIAIYALGCFRNFSCTPVPKLPWRTPPTPVRLAKEWILMLLIKTINLKTVDIWCLFFIKKMSKCLGHHYAIWDSDSNFLLAQKICSGQPKARPHFRHCCGISEWRIARYFIIWNFIMVAIAKSGFYAMIFCLVLSSNSDNWQFKVCSIYETIWFFSGLHIDRTKSVGEIWWPGASSSAVTNLFYLWRND